MSALRRTPLFEVLRALGAKLVEFGGWEMPVSYRGILEEHRAVRTGVGLFDVSHMGEIALRGPRAADACQRLGTNDVRKLVDGQVQYTILCTPAGGVVDDVTLYRRAADEWLFCVNASSVAKDLAWIAEHAGGATVVDHSDATGLVALQGPAAERVLASVTGTPISALGAFRFMEAVVGGVTACVSRTGYTGEDGFELFVNADRTAELWAVLMEAGYDADVTPVGLGARDTLRLEAALPLYGNELDAGTSPLAAGLGRFVALDGEDFLGREALWRERAAGSKRRLVGLELASGGIARHGYDVERDGAGVGVVTSGTHSPTLGRAIALAYVDADHATPGTRLEVTVRARRVPAVVVPTPFYRRSRPATKGGSG